MRPDRGISMIKRFLLAASFLLGLTLPAFAVSNWYVCSTCYTAVPQWAATTAYNSSTPSLVRQLAAPAVNSERVFRETVSTCTSGSTEPTWILTNGGVTASDGTCSWTEATGVQAYQHIGSTTTWTAPAARYNDISASGNSKIIAGDTVFCSNSHAETQSTNLIITLPSSSGLITSVMSVNPTNGNIPPIYTDITSGCAITSTGDTTFSVNGGSSYFNGVVLTGASGGLGTLDNFILTPTSVGFSTKMTFVNSTHSASTEASLKAFLGNANGTVNLNNTTLAFGNVGDSFSIIGGFYLVWTNTLSAINTGLGVTPTNVFALNAGAGGINLDVHGNDFSALTTGHYLMFPGSGNADGSYIMCKSTTTNSGPAACPLTPASIAKLLYLVGTSMAPATPCRARLG